WLLICAVVGMAAIIGTVFLTLHFRQRAAANMIAYAEFRQRTERGEFGRIEVREEGGSFMLTGRTKDSPDRSMATLVPASALDGNGWKGLQDVATKGHAELEFEPGSRIRLP
ncbi:MAG TPA: hypothetical protein VHM90_20680, partial [Phycisphaerae bacterium]|nr:hypothetical protein [Phycisphaerae bacterium]